ncbi:hypothetical protein M8J77_024481 [Diaphorina citri]|nr:hypothetical protein M8J77_024481 [Diaphorina citri]
MTAASRGMMELNNVVVLQGTRAFKKNVIRSPIFPDTAVNKVNDPLIRGSHTSPNPHIENSIIRFTTMLTEPILSHESEYPFPVVPTVLKLAGQGTSDSADSRARLVLYEPAHSCIELTL